MVADLLRHIGDHIGSYLGSVVVAALVFAGNRVLRPFREKAKRPVAVYLASTEDGLADHRAAVLEKLQGGVVVLEGPGDRAQMDKADLFVGLYAWQHAPVDAAGESISRQELDHAYTRHGSSKLRLWIVLDSQHWSPDLLDDDYKNMTSKIRVLRRRVFELSPAQLPGRPEDLAREVAAAVRERRRDMYEQSRIMDGLLDRSALLIGAAAAFAASVIFAVRIASTDAPHEFVTVLLLGLVCGLVGYAVRAAAAIWFLR